MRLKPSFAADSLERAATLRLRGRRPFNPAVGEEMSERTERVRAYFDQLAQDYDASLPWDELTERIYDELTWHHIEPYLPSAGLVLDAGGGTGKWAIPIAERGLKVVLLDLSEGMLEVARRKIEKRDTEDRHGHL